MPRQLFLRATLCAALLCPVVAAAQDVTEPALKAAFIYNFVQFTAWPDPLPASEPFLICVVGDPAVGDALQRVVAGREFAGRRLQVSVVPGARSNDACRVLYLSGATAKDAASAIAGLQDSPVLTISDIDGFIDAGGMAQFFFERSRLRFTIKIESVRRSRLQMSSRLLALAQGRNP